jgi:hypothetical protein
MSYTSLDDMTAELALGKAWRADWNKITGAVAYAAGNWYDMSLPAGNPVANTYAGTALAATVPTEATGWGIYHGGNVSTDTKQVLNASAFSAVATAVPSVLMLVDVALYYPGINLLTTTAAQTLTNGTSLTRYTTGAGLRCFMVGTARTGTPTGTPVMTMSYTNQGGTAGRALGATVSFTAGAANVPTPGKITHSGVAANNHAPFLPLASGDTGIRSVQSVTMTTNYGGATTITGALVLAKPLVSIPIVTLGVAGERNTIFQIPSSVVIPDGACLSWIYFAGANTAASTSIMGHIDFGWS